MKHNKSLAEIRDEIEGLCEDALNVLRREGNTFMVEQAKAYWYGQILSALGGTDNYFDGMCTLKYHSDAIGEESDDSDEEYTDEDQASEG